MAIRPPIEMWKNIRDLSTWCSKTTVTPNADSISTDMIQNEAITNAKLRNSVARSVIGRASASIGVPADIAATADGQVLQRLAGILQFETLNASAVAFTPSGGISATFVSTALAELDTEKLSAGTYTAADVLAKLLTVDGAASGLDADLLDGQSSAYYRDAGNINAGTLDDARIPSGIARDSEVSTAVSDHAAAADPHTGYALESAFKAQRVTTGSISAGSTALVALTWSVAFADANYTATASVLDSTTSSLSLSVVHIETISASQVQVRVLNNAIGSLTGTLHVMAIHD